MPAKSQAQFRFFKAAEHNPGLGVSAKVAREFTSGFHNHPGSVKALPQRIPKVKAKDEGGGTEGGGNWVQQLRDFFLGPQGPPQGGISSGGVRAARGGQMPQNYQKPMNDPEQRERMFRQLTPASKEFPEGEQPPFGLPDTEPSEPKMESGGMTGTMTPWYTRASARNLVHDGLLNTAGFGRKDNLPIGVKGGSYVIPADIVSGLGQGNSRAGASVLDKMFKTGPYGTTMPKLGGGRSTFGGKPLAAPKPMATPGIGSAGISAPTQPKLMQSSGGPTPLNYAQGGQHPDAPGHVPIVAAGGEYIIHVDTVANIGDGDVERGHKILDHFVNTARAHNIKTLKKLPGPKK